MLSFRGVVAELGQAIEDGQFVEEENQIGDTVLHASISDTNGTLNATVDVETTGNRRPGPYRYIYIAQAGDTIRTAEGTVLIFPAQAWGGDDRDPEGDDRPGNGGSGESSTTRVTGHAASP